MNFPSINLIYSWKLKEYISTFIHTHYIKIYLLRKKLYIQNKYSTTRTTTTKTIANLMQVLTFNKNRYNLKYEDKKNLKRKNIKKKTALCQ